MTDLVTAPQKTKLRSDQQAAQVFAILDKPVTVFSCRVNQTFDTHDMVAEFAYDGATGSYTAVKPDMTVLIGTTAGAYDVGMARARKAWGAAAAYVGEGSEIDWANDLYITVIDEFNIWPRHIRYNTGAFYADYDVAYSDQHTNRDPMPLIGGDRVAELTGATVVLAFTATDGLGLTISSHLWECAGATISANTSANTNITFSAGGRYVVYYTATSSAGKSFTRVINAYILGGAYQPFSDFTLDAVDSDSGTVFSMTCYDNVAASDIRERGKVILFERAWYQGVAGSVGVVAGEENIIATGWISVEPIEADPELGSVSFSVENAFYWLDRIQQFPNGVEDTTGTASAWTNINGLTVDKAIWHVARWRSTLSRVMDIHLTGDTRQTAKLAAGLGSVANQITSTAQAILASPAVDRYGRLWIQIDHNLTPTGSRSADTVMTVTDADIQRVINLRRATVSATAQVDLSGVAYSGGSGAAYRSLSNGHVFKHYGTTKKSDYLALSSQTQGNELAGLMAGKDNNEFPEITLTFAGINHVFDTAPQQLAALSISAAQNPRGVGFTGNAIPRRISYQHDPMTGRLVTQVTFEAETFAESAITGELPDESQFPSFPPFPPYPPLDPPEIPDPIEYGEIPVRAVYALIWDRVCFTSTINETTPVWIPVADSGTDGEYYYDIHADRLRGLVFVDNTINHSIDLTLYTNGISSILFPWIKQGDLVNPFYANHWVLAFCCNPYSGALTIAGNSPVEGTLRIWSAYYPASVTYEGGGGFAFTPRAATTGSSRTYTGTAAMMTDGEGKRFFTHSNEWIYIIPWATVRRPTSPSVTSPNRPSYHIRADVSGKLVSVGASVRYSTDNGDNWTTATNTSGLTSEDGSMAISADGLTWMSGGSIGGNTGIYKSTDDGDTWTLILAGASGDAVDQFRHIVNIGAANWLASTFKKIYASTDDGATWRDVTGNLATDFGYTELAYKRIDTKKIEWIL